MKKLILKEFRCVIESDDGPGSNSPYFITFVGDVARAAADNARIQVTARGEWNDKVDANDLFVVNEVINTAGNQANPNPFTLDSETTIVLVALLEEDGGFDITKFDHVKLEAIRTALSVRLGNMKREGVVRINGGAQSNFIELRDIFERKIKQVIDNDDLLGVRPTATKEELGQHPWLTGRTGDLPLLKFVGDGYYKVRYTVQ